MASHAVSFKQLNLSSSFQNKAHSSWPFPDGDMGSRIFAFVVPDPESFCEGSCVTRLQEEQPAAGSGMHSRKEASSLQESAHRQRGRQGALTYFTAAADGAKVNEMTASRGHRLP